MIKLFGKSTSFNHAGYTHVNEQPNIDDLIWAGMSSGPEEKEKSPRKQQQIYKRKKREWKILCRNYNQITLMIKKGGK